MGFIKRAFDFLSRPTHSRTMGLVVMLILLVAVSLTVIVSQQKQTIRQRAEDYCADTTIDNCPSGLEVIAGNTCTKENFKCKIGNNIYECAKE